MIQYNIKQAWQAWVTPRTTNPEAAFRERTLRSIYPLILFIWVLMYPLLAGLGMLHHQPIEVLVTGIIVAAMGIALWRQAILVAALVFISFFVLVLYTNFNYAYWFDSNLPLMMLLVFVISIVMPKNYLFPSTLALLAYYSFFAITQEAAGRGPEALEWYVMETATTSILVYAVALNLESALLGYLRTEFDHRFDQLAHNNITLESRVAERTRDLEKAYQEMQAAHQKIELLYAEQVATAEKLRAVDQMKSQFLASMSHELRTPLNAILNFTRFVSDGMLGPVNPKQVDALTKTINSGKHLLALINDVLDITKIESNMLSLFVEKDISLNEELNVVVATAQSLLTDKPVSLIVDIEPNLPLIVCDRRRVRQILLNLVSNACKFTDEGHVTLSAHVIAGQAVVRVTDTGPGIRPEEHEAIFESFRQTKTGLRQGGGTGLGLAIARRLVEAHGGKLWLESTVGVGSSFYVELPIESPDLIDIMTQSMEVAAVSTNHRLKAEA
jgi:signal transduction histidine kinase